MSLPCSILHTARCTETVNIKLKTTLMKQFQNKISVVEKGKMYTPNTQTMIA